MISDVGRHEIDISVTSRFDSQKTTFGSKNSLGIACPPTLKFALYLMNESYILSTHLAEQRRTD